MEKMKVNYAILEDMEKYVVGFNKKDYIETSDETDERVISFLRSYYNKNLPVDVTAWIRVNQPEKNLIYGKDLSKQICFVRDELHWRAIRTDAQKCEEDLSYEDSIPIVISTHISKSVTLPVYKIDLKEYGVELILRNNFYGWVVSVKSDKPLDYNFFNLFDIKEEILSIYCEGFPEDRVYGSFEKDKSKFTFSRYSDYDIYMFVKLLMYYLRKEE